MLNTFVQAVPVQPIGHENLFDVKGSEMFWFFPALDKEDGEILRIPI